jgi:hypothetical protein
MDSSMTNKKPDFAQAFIWSFLLTALFAGFGIYAYESPGIPFASGREVWGPTQIFIFILYLGVSFLVSLSCTLNWCVVNRRLKWANFNKKIEEEQKEKLQRFFEDFFTKNDIQSIVDRKLASEATKLEHHIQEEIRLLRDGLPKYLGRTDMTDDQIVDIYPRESETLQAYVENQQNKYYALYDLAYSVIPLLPHMSPSMRAKKHTSYLSEDPIQQKRPPQI